MVALTSLTRDNLPASLTLLGVPCPRFFFLLFQVLFKENKVNLMRKIQYIRVISYFECIALILFMITGCASDGNMGKTLSPQEMLIGTWTSIDGSDKIVFYDDGTCASGSDENYDSYDYSLGTNTIKLSNYYGDTEVYDYTLEGFNLTLTYNGESIKFYKETDEPVYITKTEEELLQQLESSEIFNETVEEYRSENQTVSTELWINDAGMNDEYSTSCMCFCELTCHNVYTYMTEMKSYYLCFVYEAKADDFYLDNTILHSSNEDWNLVGTWTYSDHYSDSMWHEFERYFSLTIESFDGDILTGSYSYLNTDGQGIQQQLEGSGTYSATRLPTAYPRRDPEVERRIGFTEDFYEDDGKISMNAARLPDVLIDRNNGVFCEGNYMDSYEAMVYESN